MSYVERMDDAPPDDGNTIDAVPGDAQPRAPETLPPSKLPVGQQFDCIVAWWKADADHSREWRQDARMWRAFRAGEQWTPEDKALLDSQQRPHIVFNRILTILKAVAGMEINGRHEIHFIPRGTQNTAVNEVLSGASKWMADECDGEDEESQAFDDTATVGMGWCEQRMSYEDDPAGLYVEEAVDPLEMYWDRTAKKKNISDGRRFFRARKMPLGDAMSLFPGNTRDQLDARWADDMLSDYPLRSIEEKRKRDTDNVLGLPYDDQTEVTIVQAQWWERETYWIVADQATNSRAELSDQQYRVFETRMKALGMEVRAARMQRKVYKQAFLGSEMLKAGGPAPIKGQFSWKCVTGEFDASKGTWFGLVKTLRDPQMWANKWLSQILHILNTTAKGGVIAELDAFDDQREAEDKYAHPDTITWAANGAISGQNPKIMPKPGAGNISGYTDLLQMAIAAPYQVTGINLELLGQQDQNQPGVVESMRKQAGMTVLATLFDSLRRFRKQIGRGRLFFIQNFLSDERLIRITGPDYVKSIPLSKEATTGEYDVIVDDTPTSPNQKEANWAIIQPLLAVFKEQLMAQPKVFAMLLEYSPLPSRIVESIKAFIDQAANDPQAQQDRELAKKLTVDAQVAAISKDQSIAEMNNQKAGATQATAMYDIAMARNLLAKNDTSGLEAHLKMMELQQSAAKTAADVDHTKAKTARELVGADADATKAHNDTINTVANARAATMGHLIDHLSAQNDRVAAVGGLHRDMAAARKSHAEAALTNRTPAPEPPPEDAMRPATDKHGPMRIPGHVLAKAVRAPDGHKYISDPMRPGKFLRVHSDGHP